MKSKIEIFLFILIISLFVFSPLKAFAVSGDEICIRDINGHMIKTGQQYYLVCEQNKHKALTYKKSLLWNYILESENTDTSKTVGTPVEFYTENNFGVNGLPIINDNKVFIKMNGEFLNFNSGVFSWVWLDKNKEDTIKFVQENNQNTVAISLDGIGTIYYDKFGRPCDEFFSDHSRTEGKFFELTHIDGTGQKYYDENWLAIYPYSQSNVPKYYLIPVQ